MIVTGKKKSRLRNSTPLYEENFRRLKLLLPNLCEKDSATAYSASGKMTLKLNVLERFRYTTTLTLCLSPLEDYQSIASCTLTLRMYWDARVVEVVGFQGHQCLLPRYNYPNDKMYLPDEKRQANRLLCDLLTFCRRMRFTFA